MLLRGVGPSQQHWVWVLLGGQASAGLLSWMVKGPQKGWGWQTPTSVQACNEEHLSRSVFSHTGLPWS